MQNNYKQIFGIPIQEATAAFGYDKQNRNSFLIQYH